MSSSATSIYSKPASGLRIREGAPPVQRPTKEEIANFPKEAEKLLSGNWQTQNSLIKLAGYKPQALEGKHFLLAGATGPGLGGAFATMVMEIVKAGGSLTVLSRDLSKSLGYETGKAMQAKAEAAGLGNRFQWLNDGMALEGKVFEKIVSAIKESGADRVIYINTVASANSGLLPDHPPVYVKDVDSEGLFQWQLTALDDRAISATKEIMGTMAVKFPAELEKAGIPVEVSVFADWRGSLDRVSRRPDAPEYGRQGAYSTSLYLPKDILQEAAGSAYGTKNKVMDIFYPVMKTRALAFIPGGLTMASILEKLMAKAGVRWVEVPELALMALDQIHRAVNEGDDNPFPRLDLQELEVEQWFYEVVKNLNDDENSDFYYKRWVEAPQG